MSKAAAPRMPLSAIRLASATLVRTWPQAAECAEHAAASRNVTLAMQNFMCAL
jgi:hypothetical protein